MAIENKGAIRYYGQLFVTKGKNIPKAVQKAANDTQTYASLVLRANTPVKTGHLRDSWNVMQTKKGLGITNNAKYAIYVEMGTKHMAGRHMLENSLPSITEYFKDRLTENLGKSLAAEVRKGSEVTYESLRNESNFKNGLS